MKMKYSRQRAAIKEYLNSTHEHPNAEIVYENLKERFPNISLGTVYRNLSLLSELGEIKKVATQKGPDRFDAELRPHYHFSCMECGDIIDIFVEEDNKNLSDSLMKNFKGTVLSQEVQFYGLCEKCCKKSNNNKNKKTDDK